jgi:hypothetical protein
MSNPIEEVKADPDVMAARAELNKAIEAEVERLTGQFRLSLQRIGMVTAQQIFNVAQVVKPLQRRTYDR